MEVIKIIWNDTSLVSTIISLALLGAVVICLGTMAFCLAQPKMKDKIISTMCLLALTTIMGNFTYSLLENYAEKIQKTQKIEIKGITNGEFNNINPY